MTRLQAIEACAAAAQGLGEEAETACVERLLERIAQHPHPEALRAALCELGARALLAKLRRAG